MNSKMEVDQDAEMPSSSCSTKGCEKKRFEVKKWNACALWAWDIVVDNCAICRNHIMDLGLNVKQISPLQPLKNLP